MPQTAGEDRDEYFLMESYIMMPTERAGRVLCHTIAQREREKKRHQLLK